MNNLIYKNIVIIEDDQPTLDIYKDIIIDIPDFKFNIIEFLSGDDFLNANSADLEKAHLIISDIIMPGVDGLTTIRALGERGFLKTIPVLFVTGDQHPSLPLKLKKLVDSTLSTSLLHKGEYETDELILNILNLIKIKELFDTNEYHKKKIISLEQAKNNYLTSRLTKIVKTKEHLDVFKKFIINFGYTNIPMIKALIYTIEKITPVINKIVGELDDADRLMKQLPNMIELLKTVEADFTEFVLISAEMGLLDKDQLLNENPNSKTDFFGKVEGMYNSLKISLSVMEELKQVGDFSWKLIMENSDEDSDNIILF